MTGPLESADLGAKGDADLEKTIAEINSLFASIVGSEENAEMLFSVLDANGLLEDPTTDPDDHSAQT